MHLEQQKQVGAEMVNPEEFFDKYLGHLFALIVATLPAKQRNEIEKRIAVGSLENAQINAFIIRSNDGKFFAILLNRALLAMINHYVKLVAAANHPADVLYCNGRPVANLSKADYCVLNTEMLEAYATTREPRGPELKLALHSEAISFVEAALNAIHLFVLAHEIGHYINGDLNVRKNFAKSEAVSNGFVFRNKLSHGKEYKADEVAFDAVLRVLRSASPDFRARRALDLSVILFFNFVRGISNAGSESHPRPSDRLLAVTHTFFGEAAAVTMARSFSDPSQIEEFRKRADRLTVADVLLKRDDNR